MMLAIAICWFIATLSFLFKTMALMWIGQVLLLAVVIVGVIFMNTSKKIKRK